MIINNTVINKQLTKAIFYNNFKKYLRQDESSNGNGALMRISPLVFLLMKKSNLIEQVEFIKKYTIVTHHHPRSIVASIIYILLLKELLVNDLLPEVLEAVQSKLEELFSQNSEYKTEYDNHFKEICDIKVFKGS